jgi:hypothetical protein
MLLGTSSTLQIFLLNIGSAIDRLSIYIAESVLPSGLHSPHQIRSFARFSTASVTMDPIDAVAELVHRDLRGFRFSQAFQLTR